MGPTGRIYYLITLVLSIVPLAFSIASAKPEIFNVAVVGKSVDSLSLRVIGVNFIPHPEFRTTESIGECEGPDNILNGTVQFLSSSVAYLKISLPHEPELHLCVRPKGSEWGLPKIKVFTSKDLGTRQERLKIQDGYDKPLSDFMTASKMGFPSFNQVTTKFVNKIRRKRSEVSHHRRHVENTESSSVILFGMRVESSDSNWGDDGVVKLLSHSTVRIRLFGQHLSSRTVIAFTSTKDPGDGTCEFPSSEIFSLVEDPLSNYSATVDVMVPGRPTQDTLYYLCLKNVNNSGISRWRHQGDVPWLKFHVYDKMLPVWATIVILILLLTCSALFSGLTLGLMSLDKTDLKILCNTGKELERKYAAAIMPVRSHGSLLLCSLLLGNVLVNSVLTILMDDLTSGLVAVIFSTLAIVIFGEIMPQAVCSRHGLAVGAKTIYITKFVILLTAVIAYPISKMLDYLLGEEIGNVYNRERLNELVKTGADIEKDEVNIISGALQLSKKTVASVMTKLEDVYMLSYDTILDFETVSEIMNSGYSRIPVYDRNRSSIVSLLYIKDLAFVDPDDNTPLRTLCEFYQNGCFFVFEDMTLDVLFKKFKEGSFGHMAFVQRVNSEGEGDPFYETLGLITLEDVIEELIQAEIVDETDVWLDNRSKRKREKIAKSKNFGAFAEKREHQRIHISAHLTLATFQFLSTSVDPFKSPMLSPAILQRMLQQDVFRHIKAKNKDREIVYEQGKAADYFVLILEGRVEVLVGKENMRFESGPFTHFGVQALLPHLPTGGESPISAIPASATGSMQSMNIESVRHPFVPDYTVRPTTELFYAIIKRSLYIAALRATRLELSKKAGDHFDDEVDKLLHIDDEEKSHHGSQSSLHTLHREKESPLIIELSSSDAENGPNGLLTNAKHRGDVSSDSEERTTLLETEFSSYRTTA